MMKIGVLTLHHSENYGSNLMAYALIKTLNALGAEAELIDYRSEVLEQGRKLFRITGRTLKEKTKKFVGTLFRYPMICKRKDVFESFRQSRIPMSKAVDNENISSLNAEYESFITGSDQVFKPSIACSDLSKYLLAFVHDDKLRYSYAASFGQSRLEEKDKELFSKELGKFRMISLREENCINIVSELTDRPVAAHVDPTLLLCQEEWMSICSTENIKEQFILLYEPRFDCTAYQYARALSKETGFHVICIDLFFQFRWLFPEFRYIDEAGPELFLRLIKDARYVVTDSYHGTVFSLQFNKDFTTILLKGDTSNNRIVSLLSIVGLEDRATYTKKIIQHVPIDWNDVEKKLERERERGLSYLKRVVEGYDGEYTF